MENELMKVALSDHEFAAYLRGQCAIDTYRHLRNSVSWFRPDGTLAAIAFYDNVKCIRTSTYTAKPKTKTERE